MKKTITIISIICVLIIAGAVLVLTGVIDISGNKKTDETEGSAVCWVDYMGNAVLLDRNAVVLDTTTVQPEDLMELSGIDITKLVKGEKLEVTDEEALDYGMQVTDKLQAVGIPDKGEVYISSDCTATVYIKSIKILLGSSDGLTEKLEALRKFYDKVSDLDGTLDMQELDKNNMGYTFQKNTSTEP